MRFTRAAIVVAASSAAVAMAAPSQLIFGGSNQGPAIAQSEESHRDPDFVDVLEAESNRLSSIGASISNAASSVWPGPAPGDGGGWVWSSCGTDEDRVQVQSIEVSPDPPVPGKNMTVTAKGTVKGRIEEGAYADVVVKLGLIKLINREFDICEEARNNNVSVQCPVEEGEHLLAHTVALPREIPPAKFNVNLNAFDKDDENLMCLDLSIDFRKH